MLLCDNKNIWQWYNILNNAKKIDVAQKTILCQKKKKVVWYCTKTKLVSTKETWHCTKTFLPAQKMYQLFSAFCFPFSSFSMAQTNIWKTKF